MEDQKVPNLGIKISFVIMIALIFLTGACSYLNKKFGLKDDNILEESVEAIIEHETGLDIDLSWQTPEDH